MPDNKRPVLISILAYINILEGILFLLFLIIISFINGISSLLEKNTISMISLLVLLTFPPTIGFGLLKGKIWSWWCEVLLISIFTFQFIIQIFEYFIANSLNTRIFDFHVDLSEAFIGIIIGSLIIIYLLNKNVRRFFWSGNQDVHN